MNKAELINAAAEKAGLSKKDTETALNAALEVIAAALAEGDKIQLVGFGAFEVKKPRRADRPQPQDQGGDHHPRLQGARVQARQGPKGRRGPVNLSTWSGSGHPEPLFSERSFPMRLDKWLKVSRLIKRRTVANEACDNARVTANGRPVKASYDVKEGDVLEIRFGEKAVRVEVLAVSEAVKKNDAPAMYRELA